jgi:hypothetical protein
MITQALSHYFSYLEPIPKIDRNIACCLSYQIVSCCHNNHHKNKFKHTITKISDKLWDTISAILPDEKPNYTIGRPIIPYRKVLDSIVYVHSIGC